MSRQTFFLGVGLALVALAFAVTDEFVSGGPGLTERNVRRIRPGMTQADVEAIFGPQTPEAPPRFMYLPELKGVFNVNARRGIGGWIPWETASTGYWEGRDGDAEVFFDQARKVLDVRFRPRQQRGPLERLRSWLGW